MTSGALERILFAANAPKRGRHALHDNKSLHNLISIASVSGIQTVPLPALRLGNFRNLEHDFADRAYFAVLTACRTTERTPNRAVDDS